MSVADEISKLEELRNKGTISEAEFTTQKEALLKGPKKRKWYRSIWFKLAIALVGIIGMIDAVSDLGGGSKGITEIPKCDSQIARNAVQNAIEKNASANTNTLKMLDLADITEVTYDPATVRWCQAQLTTNAASQKVRYRLWLGGPKKNAVFTEVRPYLGD